MQFPPTTDNLYVYNDNKECKKSIDILTYFRERIPYINQVLNRYIRIYGLTSETLQKKEIKEKLEQRKIKVLPSVFIFNPREELLEGVDEIIAFYDTLLSTVQIKLQKQQKQQESEKDQYGDDIPLLDDTNKLMHEFYKDEAINKEGQERNASGDISTDISNRYKQSLMTRQKSGGAPGKNNQFSTVGDGDEDINFSKAITDRKRGMTSSGGSDAAPITTDGGGSDNIMSSVDKCTDDPIEKQFFQNMLEDSSKL